MNEYFELSTEVLNAIKNNQALVALESTVITHGLPYPQNLEIAQEMEAEVRRAGAIPATIALIKGKIKVGLTGSELENVATFKDVHKISARDISTAVAKQWNGGTTVAATILIAHLAGVKIFATGGIGGVHRETNEQSREMDISADLMQLSKTPIVVVCAGAKAILDLPATVEILETYSIPVIGYKTNEFPAFYSRSSGLKVSFRANDVNDVINIAKVHWKLGFQSSLLIGNPLPEEDSVDYDLITKAVNQALKLAKERKIHGQAVTPFLLSEVSKITGGDSLEANLKLLRNNAYLAGLIAVNGLYD